MSAISGFCGGNLKTIGMIIFPIVALLLCALSGYANLTWREYTRLALIEIGLLAYYLCLVKKVDIWENSRYRLNQILLASVFIFIITQFDPSTSTVSDWKYSNRFNWFSLTTSFMVFWAFGGTLFRSYKSGLSPSWKALDEIDKLILLFGCGLFFLILISSQLSNLPQAFFSYVASTNKLIQYLMIWFVFKWNPFFDPEKRPCNWKNVAESIWGKQGENLEFQFGRQIWQLVMISMSLIVFGGSFRIGTALYFQHKGKDALWKKSYEEALQAYDRALEINYSLDLGYSETLEKRAIIFWELNRNEDVEATIEEIRKRGLDVVTTHLRIGHFFYEHKAFPKAIKEYQKYRTLSFGKGDPIVSSRLMNCYFKEEYLKNKRKILELAREYPFFPATDSIEFKQIVFEGQVYIHLGKYEKAVDKFQKAIRLKGSSEIPFYSLGFIFKTQKNYTKAIEYLKKSVELKPNFVDAIYLLGKCEELIGKRDDARIMYEKAISINPNHLETLEALSFFNLSPNEKRKIQTQIDQLTPIEVINYEISDEVEILGFDSPSRRIRLGDELCLTIYWRLKRHAIADPIASHFLLLDNSEPNSPDKYLAVNNGPYFGPTKWAWGEVRKIDYKWKISESSKVPTNCQYIMHINILFNDRSNWEWSKTFVIEDFCILPQ